MQSKSGLSKFFEGFDIQASVSTIIGKKISKYVAGFLDGVGEPLLTKIMEDGLWLTDCLPDNERMRLKALAMPVINIIVQLDPEIVYAWFPEKYLDFFDSKPHGKEWAVKQLVHIKELLVS